VIAFARVDLRQVHSRVNQRAIFPQRRFQRFLRFLNVIFLQVRGTGKREGRAIDPLERCPQL
jgi:hypothetical protein